MAKLALDHTAFGNDSQRMEYIISQLLGRNAFISLGKITAVVDGSLTIQPLLHSQDADGALIQKPVVYGIPWFRLLCGASAIIMDPVVGDIGLMAICDRDITNVKSTSAAALPATDRRHSYSDAIWLGGIGSLNSKPVMYIEFSGDTTLNIVSPGEVNVSAATANITADGAATIKADTVTVDASTTTFTQDIVVNGEATIGGIVFSTHKHGGVESGDSTTSTPE